MINISKKMLRGVSFLSKIFTKFGMTIVLAVFQHALMQINVLILFDL
jgi:hypothetical protein